MSSLLSAIRATWLELFHGYHAWQGPTVVVNEETLSEVLPVPYGTLVDVIYRDGKRLYALPAGEIWDDHAVPLRDASHIFWVDDGLANDIVFWKLSA